MNYHANRGGITGAVEELINSMKQNSLNVDIISTHGAIKDRIKNIANIFKIASRYDLIMTAGCADFGFLPIIVGVIAGRIFRKRIIVDFHEGYPKPFMDRFGKAIKLFLGKIPVTVASKYLFDIFSEYKFDVTLIPYHFHYENFPKRENSFVWNNKIMWVGSFQFMYDPETALKACSEILKERKNIDFYFFGSGPLFCRLKEKYIHPNIIFKGFIPREMLLKEYQNYCIFLNTSFGDNFPLRLVEAAFYELLVISVRYGGTATIYDDKECLFFEKGDYKKLSEYILRVLEKPSLYDSFRKNMHETIMGFTWERVRDKWLQLILPR
jgi:glycosyltransferase involved in cell wall biosynthesis